MSNIEDREILSRSPLVLVLAQIQFPYPVPRLGDSNPVLNANMEEIGFPFSDVEQEYTFEISPEGKPLAREPKLGSRLVFHSTDATSHVIITQQAITLYISVLPNDVIRYKGRAPFAGKLAEVVRVLGEVADSLVDLRIARIGYRYVNVLDSTDKEIVQKLVSAELSGFAFMTTADPATGRVISATSQLSIGLNSKNTPAGSNERPDTVLQIRSGVLLPGETVDPAIQPRQEAAWVLDLDSSTTRSVHLNATEVKSAIMDLATQARSFFFDSVVTSGFVERYR